MSEFCSIPGILSLSKVRSSPDKHLAAVGTVEMEGDGISFGRIKFNFTASDCSFRRTCFHIHAQERLGCIGRMRSHTDLVDAVRIAFCQCPLHGDSSGSSVRHTVRRKFVHHAVRVDRIWEHRPLGISGSPGVGIRT